MLSILVQYLIMFGSTLLTLGPTMIRCTKITSQCPFFTILDTPWNRYHAVFFNFELVIVKTKHNYINYHQLWLWLLTIIVNIAKQGSLWNVRIPYLILSGIPYRESNLIVITLTNPIVDKNTHVIGLLHFFLIMI